MKKATFWNNINNYFEKPISRLFMVGTLKGFPVPVITLNESYFLSSKYVKEHGDAIYVAPSGRQKYEIVAACKGGVEYLTRFSLSKKTKTVLLW